MILVNIIFSNIFQDHQNFLYYNDPIQYHLVFGSLLLLLYHYIHQEVLQDKLKII